MRPVIENLFKSHIPVDLVAEMESPFREEEVKEAVFGMDGARSSKPNGFSLVFQTYWETIKDDLMKVFVERGGNEQSHEINFNCSYP